MNSGLLRSFDDAASHLVDLLPRLRSGGSGGTIVVGLGGPTAVGKSTLARILRSALEAAGQPARVMEGDRYLTPWERRAEGARFPDGIYDVEMLRRAVADLKAGRITFAPFHDRGGRATKRITVPLRDGCRDGGGAIPDAVADACRCRGTKATSHLVRDDGTGDVLEVIHPESEVWIFDSELALYYPDLTAHYSVSYGIRAPRELRKRNFLRAVAAGDRYPLLSEAEAVAKIEEFFETDDAVIEPTVDWADHQIELE